MDGFAGRLLVAQVFDAATFAAFWLLFGSPGAAERSPVVQAAMAVGGLLGVLALKLAPTAFVCLYPWPVAGRVRTARAVLMTLATASGAVGTGFNVLALSLAIGA